MSDQPFRDGTREPAPWATPAQFIAVPGRPASGPRGFMGGPSAPAALAPASSIIAVPPVSVDKPPQGIDFRADGVLAAVSNLNTPALVCSQLVPAGMVGYLKSLVLQVNTLLTTSIIRWSLTIDDVPVEGWNNVRTLPGNISTWVATYGPDETTLEVPGSKTLAVYVIVDPLDAAAYQVGAQFHGWWVTQAVADAFRAAWGG